METIINEYEKYKENKRGNELLSSDFDLMGWDKKKEYLRFECNFTCQSCGNNEWLGNKIPLEVDHIDGDNSNNKKSNLKVLCPNCHALTSNWRGRNKTNKINRISNSKLLEVLINNQWNFRQSLLEVGLTAKGGNYKRCHQLKREYSEFGSITENNLIVDIEKEEFINVFNSSENVKMICEKLNISYVRGFKYMKLYECKYLNDIPTLNELIDKYKELGSLVQVGVFYNLSDNGVRKWFIKYGINPKTLKNL
jgi:5-methylcytosine-specific restriction endonuclease McrA